MKYNLGFILVTALIMTLSAMPAFSQDTVKEEAAAKAPEAAPVAEEAAAKAPEAAPAPVKEKADQPKELSIYGEVQSVNASANSMTLQYYDYDSDEEKTATVVTGKDTKMENAASLNDIKQGDWVDVTYTVSDGKFIAKSVSVEKEEAQPPANVAGTEIAEDAAAEAPIEE